MEATANKLPNDSESLRNIVVQQRSVMTQLRDNVAEQTAKLKHQKDLIDQLLDAPSDDCPDEQTGAPTTVVKSFERKQGGRRRLPQHLPRIEIVHELDGDALPMH